MLAGASGTAFFVFCGLARLVRSKGDCGGCCGGARCLENVTSSQLAFRHQVSSVKFAFLDFELLIVLWPSCIRVAVQRPR